MILFEEFRKNRLLMLVLTTWPTSCLKEVILSRRLLALGIMMGGTMLANPRAVIRTLPAARWVVSRYLSPPVALRLLRLKNMSRMPGQKS